ncbi:MAG: hypothetical protein DRJ50_08015 [Actinobacteria bacterium]|nr:MAG: hypothetical protein DRJ50_08015 [Actinomycetota bacterium]
MAAHPDGFASLQDASDVIAADNRHRSRPTKLDGLLKVLRQRDDGRYIWRWDPAFVTSKADPKNNNPGGSEHRMEIVASQLLDGASRITAPTHSSTSWTRSPPPVVDLTEDRIRLWRRQDIEAWKKNRFER